jgi:hypothetical protein
MNDEHSNGNRVDLTLVELRVVIRMYGCLVAQRDGRCASADQQLVAERQHDLSKQLKVVRVFDDREIVADRERVRRNNRRVRCLCFQFVIVIRLVFFFVWGFVVFWHGYKNTCGSRECQNKKDRTLKIRRCSCRGRHWFRAVGVFWLSHLAVQHCASCLIAFVSLVLVQHVDTLQVLGNIAQLVGHGLFGRSERHTGIVVLLVGLIGPVRVANLSLQVRTVLEFVRTNTIPKRPLRIGIDIHLDDTGINRVPDIFGRRTTTTVKDKHHGFVITNPFFFHDILLRIVQNDRLEFNIAGCVHTMDVTKRSSAGKHAVRDLAKFLVRVINFFRLRVQTGTVRVGIVCFVA